jgi:predicted CXXCH cytochrome family protein
MNAKAAIKAALIVGWLLAAAAFIWAGNAAPVPVDAAVEAAPKAKDHPKIGKEDCATCHSDVTSKPTVHGATADCTSCHSYTEPAGSETGKIALAASGSDLCFTCHTDIQDKLKGKKLAHPPAQEDCLTCHNPHSSDNAGLLKDKQPDLCGACHTDIGEKIAKSKFTHGAIKDHGCSACHDPHASDTAKFLADEPEKLCMSCHRWEEKADPKNTTKHRILDTPDGMGHPLVGHPFRDVPDPSADGKPLTCLSCHDPHVGPDRPRLKPGKAQNDFCSRCH